MAEEKQGGMSNLGLVAVLVLAYAGGQWMMLTAIDEKLSALEQRIVTSASHVEGDVNRVGDAVVQAARATVAATKAARGEQPPPEAAAPAAGAKPSAEKMAAEKMAAEKQVAEKPAAPAAPAAPAPKQ